MRIGVLSDTHGHLDPRVPDLFRGADHILHAGDIGYPSIILELETIAPVTAVLGNNDDSRFDYRETEFIELAGRRFLVHHIVDPHAPSEQLQRSLLHHAPEIVVFGHTHRAFHEVIDGRLYFNPGYSGKPRLNLRRTVAVLDVGPDSVEVEFHDL